MDIQTILHLMMGGKTPETQDLAGYKTVGEYVVNPQGEIVTDQDTLNAFRKANKADGVVTPYKPITGGYAAYNPAAANYVAEQNANFVQAPLMARRNADISNLVSADQFGKIRPIVGNSFVPGASDSQMAILTGRDPSMRTIYDVNSLTEKMKAGIPASSATLEASQNAANIEVAKRNLIAANRSVERALTTEAALDQDAVNHLAESTGITPLQIQLHIDQLKRDLERNPTQQEVYNTLLKSQLYNSRVALAESQMRDANKDILTETAKNRLIGERFESNFLPSPQSPYSSVIQGDSVMPSILRSDYVPLMKMKTAMMGDLNPPKGAPVATLKNGTKVSLPPPEPATLNVRTGMPNINNPLSNTNALVSPHAPSNSNIKPPKVQKIDILDGDKGYGANDIGYVFKNILNAMTTKPKGKWSYAGYQRPDGTIIKHGDKDEFIIP